MRIHLLSDLHLEFEPFKPLVHDADVVVLAGDIHVKAKGVPWALDTFECPVLYVPGNHEFYNGHLTATLEKMRALADQNVHVMDRDVLVLNGVRFVAATMWTDFASMGNAYEAALAAQSAMTDFRVIRTAGYRRIRPADLTKEAKASRRWLKETLSAPFDGRTVVVTHHAPSLRSLQGSPHADGLLDAAYANDWEDLFGPPVDLWLHGHSHFGVDYVCNGTRVVSNPRGYPGEETGFKPDLIIDI